MDTNLAAEFLVSGPTAQFFVSGLMPFLAISFAILSVLRVYDLNFLSQAKDFSVLLATFVALSMYLLGALTQRLADLLGSKFIWCVLRLIIPRSALGRAQPTDSRQWIELSILILQHGSDRLNDGLSQNSSLLRIYSSTALTAPILAISLSTWLSGWAGWRAALAASLVCVFLTIAAAVSFFIQRTGYWREMRASVAVIREDRATR